jgi:hypothetical protein
MKKKTPINYHQLTGPASTGSLLGQSNASTPPTPWPLEGQRPYGGPQQVKGQPAFAPKGK